VRKEGRAISTPEPHEETAAHVGEEFAGTIASLRSTLRETAGLGYLAHYSSGAFDFGIDRLGDPPSPGATPPGATRRDQLRRLGRALSITASGLDRTLQKVRTGGLIRIVLQTEQGAGFCNLVVPSELVVGSVVDHEAPGEPGHPLSQRAQVRAADIAVAALATQLRGRISLGSVNPGGWESVEVGPVLSPPRPSGAPFVTLLTDLDERTGRLMAECKRAVRAADLQLVAYCTHGEVVFVADELGDRSLNPFFTQITVGARRKFYLEFSRELWALASKLNRAVSGVLGDLLLRMVLDVEQGAIYYYRLKGGDYLVGVTIDQSRVSDTDDRMSRLALAARDVLGTG
jgi:hypothetical protein